MGSVISITPAAGEQTVSSAAITLTVSTGPQSQENITVLDYRGSAADFAQSDAESKGLMVSLRYDTSDNVAQDEVMVQNPEPGSEVPAGTQIILTVNNAEKAASGEGTEGTTEEQNQTTNTGVASGSWVCMANLGAAPNYGGGAYRLVLVQTVNGLEQQSIIEQSESTLQFPYLLQITGAEGVSTGSVYLYEFDSEAGDYVPRVTWPVTFAEQN
jgi:serine/threonine-protein kinase